MEIEEKLKLAFKQGMRYKNMWTEKHGYNEKFSFDNWLAENKQLILSGVVKSFYCQSEDYERTECCKEQCITCFSKS